METYCELKPFTENPNFDRQKEKALKKLNLNLIDAPLQPMIKQLNDLPHCFTLQCCFGHFVHDKQPDENSLEPISKFVDTDDILYRIAYVAFCIKNSEQGKWLLQ